MHSIQDPEQLRRRVWCDLLLVVLAGTILFFPFLGKKDLWTSGEARVAQVARQMLNGDGWIIPQLGDDDRLKKPPLAYWLCAVCAFPYGDVDEFNSRLPNAFAGIGVMLLLYFMGADILNRTTGLLAALAVGTSAAVWWQARTTGIESPLLFFNVLGLFAWWRYHNAAGADGEPTRPWPWLLTCYFAMGLSFMQKGPVGPPLVLLIILVYLTAIGIWRPLVCVLSCIIAFAVGGLIAHHGLNAGGRVLSGTSAEWLHTMGPSVVGFLCGGLPVAGIVLAGLMVYAAKRGQSKAILQHVAGSVLLLALALPWPILVLREMPEAWAIWFRESAGRIEGFDHEKPFYYFIIKILGDGQPWVLPALLAPVVMQYMSKIERKRLLFPWVWAIVTLIFFSIPTSKKNYYILPIYPALALLAATVIAMVQDRPLYKAHQALKWLYTALGGLVLAAGIAAYPIFLFAEHLRKTTDEVDYSPVYSQHATAVLLMASTIALGHGIALLLSARRDRFVTGALATVIAASAVFALHIYILPFRNEEKGDKMLCSYLKPKLQPEDKVYTYGISGLPIFTFYLNHPVDKLRSRLSVQKVMDTGQPHEIYLLVGERDRPRFDCGYVIRPLAPDGTKLSEDIFSSIMKRLQETLEPLDPVVIVGDWRSNWPKEAIGVQTRDGVIGAQAIMVQVKLYNEEGKKRWLPEKVKPYLDEKLADIPHWKSPIGARLRRMDHPPMLNGAAWFQATHSQFHNRPVGDYIMQPSGNASE